MPTQEPEEITPDDVEEYKPNRAARRSKKPAGPARATAAMLRHKKPREREITVLWADGEDQDEITLLFRAIGSKDWDDLASQHKPTTAQRAEGQQLNVETFPPALLARVCVDPAMSPAEWDEILKSPDWNRGEVAELYGEAVALCSSGFDIPFRGSD